MEVQPRARYLDRHVHLSLELPMSDKDLIETLNIAARNNADQFALSMLLKLAALRIEELSK